MLLIFFIIVLTLGFLMFLLDGEQIRNALFDSFVFAGFLTAFMMVVRLIAGWLA